MLMFSEIISRRYLDSHNIIIIIQGGPKRKPQQIVLNR